MGGSANRLHESHPPDQAPEGMAPVTVYLVDDHDVVRKGLRFYLSAHPEISIAGD